MTSSVLWRDQESANPLNMVRYAASAKSAAHRARQAANITRNAASPSSVAGTASAHLTSTHAVGVVVYESFQHRKLSVNTRHT